jgi:hypothetical protein
MYRYSIIVFLDLNPTNCGFRAGMKQLNLDDGNICLAQIQMMMMVMAENINTTSPNNCLILIEIIAIRTTIKDNLQKTSSKEQKIIIIKTREFN